MRHRKSGRKLKRTASHRRATLASLSTALLRHKRIMTTVAKAKETRMVVEKIITRAKRASAQTDKPSVRIHATREVARLIRDRAVVGELFSTIVEKVGTRPGGYTRIVRLGQRPGDGAELAVLELVDFNTGQEATKSAAPAKRKTASRGKKAKGTSKAEPKEKTSAPSEASSGTQKS
jgi:large subunit ribosomal protein L17